MMTYTGTLGFCREWGQDDLYTCARLAGFWVVFGYRSGYGGIPQKYMIISTPCEKFSTGI